jgi:hypothetical protein
MLRPDPAQLDRLVEILDDLNARLAEAHQQGWLGEVDGLEATIAGAEQKLAAMRRATNPSDDVPVELHRPRTVPPLMSMRPPTGSS